MGDDKTDETGPVFCNKCFKDAYYCSCAAEERITELEAKVKRLTSRGFEDLHFENEELTRKLASAQADSERWRELAEALDGLLVIYRLGDMRNGASKVDRAKAARAAIDAAKGGE